MKKIIALLLVLAMALSLVACGGKAEAPAATEAPKAEAPVEAPAAEPVTIKVAAIETAYGSQVWADVAAAFEAETGIKVELTPTRTWKTSCPVPCRTANSLMLFTWLPAVPLA